MDEYSTPIEQIRPDMKLENNQQIPVNYSDLMQTMESHKNVQQMPESSPQIHSNEYPPPPMVQSRNHMHTNLNPNFVTPKEHLDVSSPDKMNILQKDVMFILIPSIILYSTQIQNHIFRVIPSLFKDDKPTMIGNIFNGIIISFVFIGLKNMKINFS